MKPRGEIVFEIVIAFLSWQKNLVILGLFKSYPIFAEVIRHPKVEKRFKVENINKLMAEVSTQSEFLKNLRPQNAKFACLNFEILETFLFCLSVR